MPIVKNLLILLFIINTTYAKGLSAVKDAEAIYQLKQQLKQLKEQLKYTQQLLDSVKGQKLDKIITTIDDNIPESWSSMYPPSEVSIVKATQYEDKQSELLLKTYDIMRNNYDNAQIRAKNIEKLMQKATNTQDLKEAQDLQNQIALEQLALQNNANQIKQMQNMIENEQKLASENIKLQNLCYSEKMYEEKLSEELASAERPEEVWGGPPMSQKCKDFFEGIEARINSHNQNKYNNNLGHISKKYESNKAVAGTISTGSGDYGGQSYGAYQITKKNMNSYLKNSKYKDEFKGLKINTPEFNKKWKEIAQRDAKGFLHDQTVYIGNTHYKPLMNNLKKDGIDFSNRSRGVKELTWSTGVQYGANTNIIKKALKGQNVNNMSDIQIIEKIQNYKANTVNEYFKKSNQQVRISIKNRALKEKKDLLRLTK